MKALFAGLGGIGQRHLRNLRTLLGDEVEILAYRVRGSQQVVTPELTIDDAQQLETRYGVRAFANLDEALAQRPDIAFITNPSSLHVETAIACANAGCDLFVEKPLSDRLDGVDALLEIVATRRLVGMTGYQLRFHPGIVRLGEIVRSGMLGHLLSVRAVVGEYLPGWHRYEDYREMYAARADLGGGVILSQIHEFDYLASLFGMPHRVFALGGHWSDLEIDVEDTASILMDCHYDGRALPVHLLQDYVQRPPSRSCEVVGDRGKVVLDLAALTLTTWNDRGEATIEHFSEFERNALFLDELRHFLECVTTRAQPVVDLRTGSYSLRIALAAKEALLSGEVVVVGPELVSRGR
jgi:predicted dehydrogenase